MIYLTAHQKFSNCYDVTKQESNSAQVHSKEDLLASAGPSQLLYDITKLESILAWVHFKVDLSNKNPIAHFRSGSF